MRLGLRPYGWSRAAYCSHCGPVWLPVSYAVISWRLDWCPWCYDATARNIEIIQRPFITCEGCRYFQRHDTDLNGRGNCGMNQGRFRPTSRHECGEWRP